MRIFITGCAKSGTTLLRRLFYAFDGVNVIDREISLYEFFSISNEGGILVGKRAYADIFSANLADGNLLKAVSHLLNNRHIRIVNIYRDGRDVIESGIKPGRWIASVRQMMNYRDLLAANVRYEDLVQTPDTVQLLLSSRLRLDLIHKFSDYPAFFREDDVSAIEKYRPRKITAENIGKDVELYKRRVVDDAQKQIFENLLLSLGYAN
jgi:hypothetical protein